MSINKWAIPVFTVVGLLVVVAWMAGVFTSQVVPGLLERPADKALNTFSVKYITRPIIESIPAGIKAREATLLSSQILARIKNIHVRAGDNVQKGQLLVTLESEGLKAQLAQSIAMVDASQAMLTEAKANFERAQTLKEKGLVSQSELDVDTGFIVYNDRTYPNFMALLARLGCDGQPTEMSFSLKRPNLEYNGHSFKTLFAQKSNLFRPRFWKMLRDIVRFNRIARLVLATDPEPLIDFCRREKFGDAFIFDYLVPMAAAIWSTGDDGILAFPIGMLSQFFNHHGLFC